VKTQTQRRIAWRWWAQELLAVALVALGLSLGTGYSSPDNVHGAVYSWAEAHPGQEVPIIVQTDGADGGVVTEAERLGGTVTQDFDFIPGFAARMEPQLIGQPRRAAGLHRLCRSFQTGERLPVRGQRRQGMGRGHPAHRCRRHGSRHRFRGDAGQRRLPGCPRPVALQV